MKIGVDCDGVLTDFEWFIDYFGAKYLKKRKLSCRIVNENASSFREKFNCTSREEVNFYKRYLIWYVNRMPIRENAASTIKKLRAEGHSIHIITARILTSQNSLVGALMRFFLKQWLRRNHVEYDSIYYVNLKNTPLEKAKLCQKLKLDFFIEDEPTNIEEIKKYCRVICISAQYNENMTGVYKANDFADVYNIITKGNPLDHINVKEQSVMSISEKKHYFKELQSTIKNLPFDRKAIRKYKLDHKIIMNTIGVIFKIIFSLDYIDRDRLPHDSNAIYVCNHRRSLDIPIAYCLLGKNFARFLIKREYQFTLLGVIQKKLGTIYVGREYTSSCKSSLIIMAQTVLNGESILIFPEGTRNRTSDVLLPFKYGALKIAQITEKPIIPIVIYKRSNFKYKVAVGETFKVSVSDSLEEKNRELWNIMKDAYLKLQDEELR